MEIPQSLWQPLPVLDHPPVFSFSLYLSRFPMSQLVPVASHWASLRGVRDKILQVSPVSQCKNLNKEGRHCHSEHADSNSQTFAPELQLFSFSSSILPLVTVAVCFHFVTFLQMKGLGYFFLLHIPSCSFPSNTRALENSTLLLSFSVISKAAPPWALSHGQQLPAQCYGHHVSVVFLITLPWHFHTHKHSKVFHKETLKYFWHPVSIELFSLCNRSFVNHTPRNFGRD